MERPIEATQEFSLNHDRPWRALSYRDELVMTFPVESAWPQYGRQGFGYERVIVVPGAIVDWGVAASGEPIANVRAVKTDRDGLAALARASYGLPDAVVRFSDEYRLR